MKCGEKGKVSRRKPSQRENLYNKELFCHVCKFDDAHVTRAHDMPTHMGQRQRLRLLPKLMECVNKICPTAVCMTCGRVLYLDDFPEYTNRDTKKGKPAFYYAPTATTTTLCHILGTCVCAGMVEIFPIASKLINQ
jgi:hypothetical protein